MTTPSIPPDPTLTELVERFKNIVLQLKGLIRTVSDLDAFVARKGLDGLQAAPYNLTPDQAQFIVDSSQELGLLLAVATGQQVLPQAHDFTKIVGAFTGLD
jgi:hypothetical protein